MPWLTLTGVPPYDGRYELKLEGDLFTIFEWGWVKRFAGYLPATMWDGWEGADQELFATFAVIALHRAGRITPRDAQTVFDLISQGQMNRRILIEADPPDPAGEDDARPLPSNKTVNGGSSGHGSPTSSDPSAATHAPTGTPASGTSASESTTSAT